MLYSRRSNHLSPSGELLPFVSSREDRTGMKLIKLTLLIAAVTLSIVACNSGANTNQTANSNAAQTPAASPNAAANTASQPAGEFASVRPIYAETCARCHKIDGEGGPVEVRGKKLNVPSFKKGHALKHTDEEFAKQISDGGDG